MIMSLNEFETRHPIRPSILKSDALEPHPLDDPKVTALLESTNLYHVVSHLVFLLFNTKHPQVLAPEVRIMQRTQAEYIDYIYNLISRYFMVPDNKQKLFDHFGKHDPNKQHLVIEALVTLFEKFSTKQPGAGRNESSNVNVIESQLIDHAKTNFTEFRLPELIGKLQ